jgi:hypothetical protein
MVSKRRKWCGSLIGPIGNHRNECVRMRAYNPNSFRLGMERSGEFLVLL